MLSSAVIAWMGLMESYPRPTDTSLMPPPLLPSSPVGADVALPVTEGLVFDGFFGNEGAFG